MHEQTEATLQRRIDDLKNALYLSECRREEAERRLTEIERVIEAPNPALRHDCREFEKIVERGLDEERAFSRNAYSRALLDSEHGRVAERRVPAPRHRRRG
jgi:hypothetical protein